MEGRYGSRWVGGSEDGDLSIEGAKACNSRKSYILNSSNVSGANNSSMVIFLAESPCSKE